VNGAYGWRANWEARRLRSGIGRGPCCAQARCEGNQGTVRAAKDAARPRHESEGRGNSRVGHQPGALRVREGMAGFGLGGVLSFLYLIYRLYERDGVFFLERTEVQGQRRTRKTIQPEPEAVASWPAALRNATVPAMPVSPPVCDGSHIELRIEGEGATLTLCWWALAPEGAEVLGEFSEWMQAAWPEDLTDPEDDWQAAHMQRG